MGHARPEHLAAKLSQIRLSLKLSQKQLAKAVGLPDYRVISKYEHDTNEPPLAILLAYARLAGIPLEQIVDDNLKLTI